MGEQLSILVAYPKFTLVKEWEEFLIGILVERVSHVLIIDKSSKTIIW